MPAGRARPPNTCTAGTPLARYWWQHPGTGRGTGRGAARDSVVVPEPSRRERPDQRCGWWRAATSSTRWRSRGRRSSRRPNLGAGQAPHTWLRSTTTWPISTLAVPRRPEDKGRPRMFPVRSGADTRPRRGRARPVTGSPRDRRKRRSGGGSCLCAPSTGTAPGTIRPRGAPMFEDQTVDLLPARTTMHSRRGGGGGGGGRLNVRLSNVVLIFNIAINGSTANFNGNTIVVGNTNA